MGQDAIGLVVIFSAKMIGVPELDCLGIEQLHPVNLTAVQPHL
jgi:hypothetical protein